MLLELLEEYKNMLEKLSDQLSLLMQSDDIQAGFDLKNKLENEMKMAVSGEDKASYQKIITKLTAYLLPWISSNEFENILEANLLPYLKSEINLKEKIHLRLLAYPEDSQNVLRIDYLEMLAKNKELIGQQTILEWLVKYDKFVNFKKATSLEKKEFTEKDDKARFLSKSDKMSLLKILDLFDFLTPDLEERDLKPITEKEEKNQAYSAQYDLPAQEKTTEEYSKISKISLADALKTYPEIREQLITQASIKVRNYNSPARPSIKNWLLDYTANLGYEGHSSIKRGDYLFQNENTKNLSYQDRQRLSQILKSFDDKSDLTIDVEKKQILFSETSPERKPVTAPISPAPVSPVPQPTYQPKTQEPGSNFEKVIQLEDKKSESFSPNNQRVVNLREPEKERPFFANPQSQVKNLLNIKELINIGQEESQAVPEKPYTAPKIAETPAPSMPKRIEPTNFSDRFNLQKIAERSKQDWGKPLSPADNSINHDFPSPLKKNLWMNNVTEPLDETENNLFESNNNAVAGPNNLIAGIPVKDFSQTKKTGDSDVQFSSPQKLPYEKEKEEIEKKPVNSGGQQFSKMPGMQPYIIRPASFEDN
jgi:hypothetical protein